MSILLDDLLKDNIEDRNLFFDKFSNKWYIAKPYELKTFYSFIHRVKDAIRVLKGKSFAVHYYDDE